ncbi:retinol dehydrogenase 12 [Karstenula rhodostoma CBS 690.94]|uniref:Retinol dehydrogenase 12 n=1 Tax=Karstenula rhodostoma CBS 690.94 TaxID=1392251 RepID=A0A9P4UI10_9PLEO|nr:retinol dehydrogenase 12 [Karstenula rhodostoma CBS 690.94]
MASNPSYNKTSSGIEIAQAYAESIKGKTALITGVSVGGIGDAIARAFAHAGAATIIITGRNDTKMTAVHTALSTDYPGTKFRSLKLDLNSLALTKQAAQEILSDPSIKQIDLLIANAGFGSGKPDREVTADGIESHFGANHLAHFLLVTTLLPKLKAAAKKNPPGATRIVTVSSNANNISPIRFSDWNYEKHSTAVPDAEQPSWAIHPVLDLPADPVPFSYLVAYGQSKTANVLLAVQLNKLLGGEGIAAFSLHPGVVRSTGQKELINESMGKKLEALMGPPKTLDQGAATAVVAALDPGLRGGEAVYLDDCQVSDSAPAWSTDPQIAERLWKLSEDIVKEKLG